MVAINARLRKRVTRRAAGQVAGEFPEGILIANGREVRVGERREGQERRERHRQRDETGVEQPAPRHKRRTRSPCQQVNRAEQPGDRSQPD